MNREYLKSKIGGRAISPLFTTFILGIFIINIFDRTYERNIFFVFYSLFLWIATMVRKPLREYYNLPLVMFTLWALVSVFIHSYIIKEDSVTFRYINFNLLAEGFIYILSGTILFMVCMRYLKSSKWFILLCLIPFVKEYFIIDRLRVTPLFAFGISFLIYFIYKKKWGIVSLMCLVSGLFIPMKDRILSCFSTRPFVIKELLNQIKLHPLVGSGFNKGLNPDHMVYIHENATHWIFRHNDYMSICSYLGIPALILIIWFSIECLVKSKGVYKFIVLGTIFLCLFQMTMFDTVKAVSCIILLSVCLLESLKKEGFNEKSNVTYNSGFRF